MEIIDLVKPLIEMLAGNHGWIVQVIVLIGTLRLILKPILSAIEGVVAATPTQSDDAKWAAIKETKVYKTITYLLDWFASVKLPK